MTWSPPCCRWSRRSTRYYPNCRPGPGSTFAAWIRRCSRLQLSASLLTASPWWSSGTSPSTSWCPCFRPSSGIARVEVLGGEQAEYRVEVDPERLAAFALTFGDVAAALSASNVLQAVGRLEDHYKLYLVLSDTRIHSMQTIREYGSAQRQDGLVRLEDVAKVYVPRCSAVAAGDRRRPGCGAGPGLPAAGW